MAVLWLELSSRASQALDGTLQLQPPRWLYLQCNNQAKVLEKSEMEPLLHLTALDTFRELSSAMTERSRALCIPSARINS